MTGTKVTLTAPNGTTFPAGMTKLEGSYDQNGAWDPVASLGLTGSVSSDGKTFTGTMADSGYYFAVNSGTTMRWSADVSVPAGASAAVRDFGFSLSGTTQNGAFTVAGTSPVTITSDDSRDFTAKVDSIDEANKSAVISGTGTPGAELVVDNVSISPVSDEGTWSYTVSGLKEGANKIQVLHIVGAKVQVKDLTIDIGAATQPIMAKVDSVDDDARTAKISGTATKGAEIFNGTTKIATADGDGKWNADVSGLAVGKNTLTLIQKVNGAEVNRTSLDITVENTVVAPLVVTTPANGSTSDTNRPVFSGTGDKGATIEVRGSSRVVATTTVDSDGKWSVPAGFDLGDGTYNLTVKQTPLKGDATSKTVTFSIKNTAGFVDLTAKGAFDSDVTKPATISGAATAGSTVIVRDSFGNEIARTTATSDKTYSVAIPVNKAQFGVNEFSVTQTVKGDVSAPVKVSLDYGTPTAVDITSPENGATVDKKDLTFTGTGQTGAKIDIRGTINAIATGTVVDGKWTAKVNYTLSNNVYNLWAVQTTKGGMTTRQAITITITDQAVAPLTATAAFNATDANLPAVVSGTAQNGATVTVKTSTGAIVGTATVVAGKYSVAVDPKHAKFGINSFTITQTVGGKESAPLTRALDYGNPIAPAITSPANGAVVDAGKVTFTGTGDTGSKIDMRGSFSAVGSGKVVDGKWTVETRELKATTYKLFAVQTSKGGLTKQIETTVVLRDKKVTELTAAGTFPAAADVDATISGNAETGATVVVKEGSSVIESVTAVNGKYSVAIPAIGSGVRTFAVTQTVDGVVSAAKAATLDYGTVTPVVVTSPTEGAKVKAGTVTFTGTGTPGALVKVNGTSSALGVATVNAQGDWSLTLNRQLTPQLYTLFVKQTTKGNLVGGAVERSFAVVK
ncbi:Ig-like domain-containing protein [Curtobacterium sp. PhB115]|uniref:Ig-like domain-containing protein n=1 Tax=Curtobacterium sp. PhB115 TaxID=2485173 RepID=UPI001611E9DA|nr:Ig-like domain-containing protein [Curtobacterium sp. PhB115]